MDDYLKGKKLLLQEVADDAEIDVSIVERIYRELEEHCLIDYDQAKELFLDYEEEDN